MRHLHSIFTENLNPRDVMAQYYQNDDMSGFIGFTELKVLQAGVGAWIDYYPNRIELMGQMGRPRHDLLPRRPRTNTKSQRTPKTDYMGAQPMKLIHDTITKDCCPKIVRYVNSYGTNPYTVIRKDYRSYALCIIYYPDRVKIANTKSKPAVPPLMGYDGLTTMITYSDPELIPKLQQAITAYDAL